MKSHFVFVEYVFSFIENTLSFRGGAVTSIIILWMFEVFQGVRFILSTKPYSILLYEGRTESHEQQFFVK